MVIGTYQALPGVPDECVDAAGQVRPLWQGFAAHLAGLAPEVMAARLARADRYLAESGVFFRQYVSGQSTERPWPLSHLPVLVDEAEWQGIAAGLTQRAELLEAVMADLYGANRLVATGRLPASLVAGNREWLRPMVGIRPRSGHYLQFLAFEIGRGPDGKWWVLADRTQAPSGAGYALENRVATARAFSEFYAEAQVHRLAGFYRDLRDGFQRLCQDRDGRVAILSPGPLNETYFEHAYIARYLGFTLVQGEDLTVSQGRLHIRTVAGPRPVEVLWRRLDSAYADPLELDPASRIGTPGLVSALRSGGVEVVNALGSGVLETRALMAFLPQLAESLTGRPLQMPNIATWWLGSASARAEVTASPGRMILSPALETGHPFDPAARRVTAAGLAPEALAALLAEGGAWVAQESVRLSTTPALVDGRPTPRPLVLRVFMMRGAQGWQMMPGGFARIGATPDPMAVAMQHGGSAADVWVMSAGPVPAVTMISATSGPYRRAGPGALPARAADNLFWLGRYVERAEAIVRLARACNIRRSEAGSATAPLFAAMEPLFDIYGMRADEGIPEALLQALSAASASAGAIRDRFSPDAWAALADISRTAGRMAERVQQGDDAAQALSALLRKLAGISGLVHENMYRFLGWRFLSLGRMHERAMGIAAILATLTEAQAEADADGPALPDGALDLAVELGDSVLTHRRRFQVATTRETVMDLLGLDAMNPRALRHQIDGLLEQIAALPGAADNGLPGPMLSAAMQVQVAVATAHPETLDAEALWDLRLRIGALSDLLTKGWFS